jgi:hypothetical protein
MNNENSNNNNINEDAIRTDLFRNVSDDNSMLRHAIEVARQELDNNQYLSQSDINHYIEAMSQARDAQDINDIMQEARYMMFTQHRNQSIEEIEQRDFLSDEQIEEIVTRLRITRNDEQVNEIVNSARETENENLRLFDSQMTPYIKASALRGLRSFRYLSDELRREYRRAIFNATTENEVTQLFQRARGNNEGLRMRLESDAQRVSENTTQQEPPSPIVAPEVTPSETRESTEKVPDNTPIEVPTGPDDDRNTETNSEPQPQEDNTPAETQNNSEPQPQEDNTPAETQNNFDPHALDARKRELMFEVIASDRPTEDKVNYSMRIATAKDEKELEAIISELNSERIVPPVTPVVEPESEPTDEETNEHGNTSEDEEEQQEERRQPRRYRIKEHGPWSHYYGTSEGDDTPTDSDDENKDEDDDVDLNDSIDDYIRTHQPHNPGGDGTSEGDDTPTDNDDEQEEEEEQNRTSTGILTLDSIINKLTKDLVFKESDNRKYVAKNIKVSKSFFSRFRQGNYLYNIFGAISGLFTPILNGASKLYGKITYSARIKRNVDELERRLNASEQDGGLSQAELDLLYNEYRGNALSRFGLNSIINNLIGQRLRKYAMENLERINSQLVELYNQIYADVMEIVSYREIIENPNSSDEEKAEAQNNIDALLNNKCEQISRIRELQKEIDTKWLAGGGIHGLEEDIKASKTKLSLVGKRFAKRPKFDTELMQEQASYKEMEAAALRDGNGLDALIGFLSYEKLLSDNTKENLSIFGRRSTGKRNYNPLGKELDYRDDPFARYVFGSIANAAILISLASGIKNAIEARNVNAQNASNAQYVRNQADMQLDRSGRLAKGQEAQAQSARMNDANLTERQVLDQTDWNVGSSQYRVLDDANHARYNNLYANSEQAIRSVNQAYNSGSISSVQAFEQMRAINAAAQKDLVAVASQYQPILHQYATTHPQFDLSAVTGTVDYLVANPNAIINAAQAESEILQIAANLRNVQAAELNISIIPQIIGAVAAVGFTTKVVNDVQSYINDKSIREAVEGIREHIGDADDIEALTALSNMRTARQTR